MIIGIAETVGCYCFKVYTVIGNIHVKAAIRISEIGSAGQKAANGCHNAFNTAKLFDKVTNAAEIGKCIGVLCGYFFTHQIRLHGFRCDALFVEVNTEFRNITGCEHMRNLFVTEFRKELVHGLRAVLIAAAADVDKVANESNEPCPFFGSHVHDITVRKLPDRFKQAACVECSDAEFAVVLGHPPYILVFIPAEAGADA